MGKIQRLDAHLTNMIAAGEVVERPMGVVKELVENSIDAGAKNIEVFVQEGGLAKICVIDDGEGMSASDASMAFERHATSKIHDVNDLWKIQTMGFRGEALPSIASVSHTNLKTNDGHEGTEIDMEYGILKKAMPCALNQGTQITVENLFQKTPARLKHLKTPQYEFSLISSTLEKFVFAYPNIAFTLSHDGKTTLETNGHGDLLEVIMQVYGRQNAKQAIRIHNQDFDYVIDGYILQPSVNRASKYYILFTINHRMIRSFRLQKTLIDAYSPYLPKDRYPVAVLNIDCDPQLVDVNVHPSKWEVRLSKEKALEDLLAETIRAALRNEIKTSTIEREKKNMTYVTQKFDFDVQSEIKPYVQESKKSSYEPMQESMRIHAAYDISKPLQDEIREEFGAYAASQKDQETTQVPYVFSQPVNPSFPAMQAIGQFKESYILAEGEQCLYIIDQHAAQERYHFEVISDRLLSGNLEKQPLLVPITLPVTAAAMAQLDEMNRLLGNIGLHFEAFGENTFILRELPLWISECEEVKVLQDMVDYYLEKQEINVDALRHKAIATMACHSSIRFHRALTLAEMQQVIEDLRKCKQPFHCPHGRPTFIELTTKELEKEFYRVK